VVSLAFVAIIGRGCLGAAKRVVFFTDQVMTVTPYGRLVFHPQQHPTRAKSLHHRYRDIVLYPYRLTIYPSIPNKAWPRTSLKQRNTNGNCDPPESRIACTAEQ
jgi:hypothetical protein